MKCNELENYLNEFLAVKNFQDYCPNGLQVEGKTEIKKIVTGVSACVELFEKAIEKNADTIIVHHGLIWNGDPRLYKGGYKQRIKLLLENNINFFGYHLPLDAHSEVGNNFQIAKILGLKDIEPFVEYKGNKIGFKGKLNNIKSDDFIKSIKEKINPNLIVFPFGPEKINTVGIVSGGAQREVTQAIPEAIDLYLTGEVSEYNLHIAKEEKIHFVSAGHHATEVFGIKSLSKHLQEKFNLDVEFVNINNPV